MKKLLSALAVWLALSGAAFAVVNINTASKEELVSLKGIGEKRAQEILNYRQKNGNFKTVDDLEKVPGIGPGLMKQIRSELTVTGKTTVGKSADKEANAKSTAPAKSKGTTAKTAESPKGDAMKSDTGKSKAAEKLKVDDKKTTK